VVLASRGLGWNHSKARKFFNQQKFGRTMTRNRQDSSKILQEEIRRQFRSAGTVRFLHTLPAFQVEHGIPERFNNLLSELDRAESDQPSFGTGGGG
jgi:hypothetical protein